ncbi:hypothetical protein J2T02_002871 [Chitinophaga terrae (ex Kim and Jung 2007)]|uniref:winged helix DNA-binding domain-containing protein n=1 Tax=Chitinophaga terrae (ex Kim and Jung 2007) TaxID=408074 RepID=UPI0027889E51|nr:winged helix DNA-binding domain-containing protein [Chitinophaga terrae (ex Kim and Jung 2007)]MDQ0107750.1 hypothetical protein [Chitinophaga terrae (ex Kim and Jung 2007)]
MKPGDLIAHRLINHQLLSSTFKHPKELVSWMTAIQAQEFASCQWALGARLPHLKITDVQAALAENVIVRTTALRGTLHLVAATDIRWITGLVAPAMRTKMGSRRRQLEMDDKFLNKALKTIEKALKGKQVLSRNELAEVLQRNKVKTDDGRMNHILYEAALSGIICNAPAKGDYMLLEEWIPPAPAISKPQALKKLAAGYFASHGPATLADFTAWSGLSATDAKAGLAAVQHELTAVEINGAQYWSVPAPVTQQSSAFLLPAFDEYFIGYKDRSMLADAAYVKQIMTVNGIFNPIMLLDGRIVGLWKRTIDKKGIELSLAPFEKLKKKELKAFEPEAERFADFMQLPLNRLTM